MIPYKNVPSLFGIAKTLEYQNKRDMAQLVREAAVEITTIKGQNAELIAALELAIPSMHPEHAKIARAALAKVKGE